MNIQNELTIAQRLATKTPKFFVILRCIGIALTAFSGVLLAFQEQGVVLPQFLSVFANLATVMTGLTTAGVSTLTVDVNAAKQKNAL